MRAKKERRQTLTLTVAPKTTNSLDEMVKSLNIDGVYDISRGRLVDFLVEEAIKENGFLQITKRGLVIK